MSVDRSDGELFTIYLLEQYHRRGIGRAPLTNAARCLKAQGHYSMVTWVLSDNPATGFYETLGGIKIAEKMIAIGGRLLKELAYGWIDLDTLASIEARPSLVKGN